MGQACAVRFGKLAALLHPHGGICSFIGRQPSDKKSHPKKKEPPQTNFKFQRHLFQQSTIIYPHKHMCKYVDARSMWSFTISPSDKARALPMAKKRSGHTARLATCFVGVWMLCVNNVGYAPR